MTARLALTGLAALFAGLARLVTHAPPTASVAPTWCRTPGAPAILTDTGTWTLFGHCWGCYVAVAGLLMLAVAMYDLVLRHPGRARAEARPASRLMRIAAA